jgi:anti-sigma B factor antagonist
VTIGMAGDLDATTSEVFRDSAAALIESGHRDLIADLGGLDFVDAAGLGVLVGAIRRLHDHPGILCRDLRQPTDVARAEAQGLDKALPVHSSITSIVDDEDTQS